MKVNRIFLFSCIVVLVLLGSVCLSGCVATKFLPDTKAQKVTPAGTPVAVAVAAEPVPPSTTEQTAATTKTPEPTITTTLSNGWIVSYPSAWEKEDRSDTALREYGRTTTNIANFYSPHKTGYTTLSIDMDPNSVSQDDCDAY